MLETLENYNLRYSITTKYINNKNNQNSCDILRVTTNLQSQNGPKWP